MRKIVLVEDVETQANELSNNLAGCGFKKSEWCMEIWHINGPQSYGRYLKEAAETSARVMIADLALIDSEMGLSGAAVVEMAKRHAVEAGIGADPGFWRWDDPRRRQLLPGAVLVETFAKATQNCAMKSVWIASNLKDDAKAWYRGLRAVTNASGRMDQSTIADAVAPFIIDAYEAWPAIVWSSNTSKWFSRVAPAVECSDILEHNIARDAARYEQQVDCIRNLLRSAFRFEPPASWFEKDQFSNLYKTLQHLIGACSCVGGGGDYNLLLENLPILLGFAFRECNVPRELAECALGSVVFGPARNMMLAERQPGLVAEANILRLVREVFSEFIWDQRDEEGSRRFIVTDIRLGIKTFTMTLGFDCDEILPGRQQSFSMRVADNSNAAMRVLMDMVIPHIKLRVQRTKSAATQIELAYVRN